MNKIKLNERLIVAKDLLIKEGKLMPVAFLELTNKANAIIGIPDMPQDYTDRAYMFFKLGASSYLEGKKVREISLLTETWYSKPVGKGENIITPSQDPNRREAIAIITVNAKGKCSFMMQPFKKEGEDIVFGIDKDIEEQGEGIEVKDNILKWFWRGYQTGPLAKKKIEKIEELLKEINNIKT